MDILVQLIPEADRLFAANRGVRIFAGWAQHSAKFGVERLH